MSTNRLTSFTPFTTTSSSLVFGSTTCVSNDGGLSRSSCSQPSNFLWTTFEIQNGYQNVRNPLAVLVDSGNNRVLGFVPSFGSLGFASSVYGQYSFSGDMPNDGGVSSESLNSPTFAVITKDAGVGLVNQEVFL